MQFSTFKSKSIQYAVNRHESALKWSLISLFEIICKCSYKNIHFQDLKSTTSEYSIQLSTIFSWGSWLKCGSSVIAMQKSMKTQLCQIQHNSLTKQQAQLNPKQLLCVSLVELLYNETVKSYSKKYSEKCLSSSNFHLDDLPVRK